MCLKELTNPVYSINSTMVRNTDNLYTSFEAGLQQLLIVGILAK